jgi:prevent-host-death family protein
MSKVSFSELREQLSEVLNEARYNGERTVITRHNKKVAAIVPMEDLEYLERVEDELDARDAHRIKKAIQEGKEKLANWDDIKKDL